MLASRSPSWAQEDILSDIPKGWNLNIHTALLIFQRNITRLGCSALLRKYNEIMIFTDKKNYFSYINVFMTYVGAGGQQGG